MLSPPVKVVTRSIEVGVGVGSNQATQQKGTDLQVMVTCLTRTRFFKYRFNYMEVVILQETFYFYKVQ